MAECRPTCKMPRLANLASCVAQCAKCGRYWELRATWVPFDRLRAMAGGEEPNQ